MTGVAPLRTMPLLAPPIFKQDILPKCIKPDLPRFLSPHPLSPARFNRGVCAISHITSRANHDSTHCGYRKNWRGGGMGVCRELLVTMLNSTTCTVNCSKHTLHPVPTNPPPRPNKPSYTLWELGALDVLVSDWTRNAQLPKTVTLSDDAANSLVKLRRFIQPPSSPTPPPRPPRTGKKQK